MEKSTAINVICQDKPGVLRDVAAAVAHFEGNIKYTQQFILSKGKHKGLAAIYMEIENVPSGHKLAEKLKAITDADRHNIRGERISIDTLPIIDENNIAKAVNAVSRTHRASIVVLAGSLMGGKIAQEVTKLQNEGFKVIALNMAGSVPDVADLVVTDPVQAGTFAVMAIAKTASFDLDRVSGRRF